MRSLHGPGHPDPRSILVALPTWVGDFVMATPALRAIRNRFPGAHIAFLMEPNLRELVRGGDWMNESIEWPGQDGRRPWRRAYRDLVWDLRRRQFDWAVLLPNSFRSALLARFIKAKRRIGYDRDGRGWLLTDRLPVNNRWTAELLRQAERRGHFVSLPPERFIAPGTFDALSPMAPQGKYWPMPIVEYYADLAEALGCERPGDRLELFTTTDADLSIDDRLKMLGLENRGPLVVLSPGAKYGAAKCWLPDRFAATADRLIETDDAVVVVTCGPGEEPIAQSIAGAMRHTGHLLIDPLLSLGELKSLILLADLLICNDAGPRHFAKAFDVPVVTIFGPTHPQWTATSYVAERIVRVDVDCGPCQQRVCPLGHLKCMTGVSVDMVITAARELLAGRTLAATTR